MFITVVQESPRMKYCLIILLSALVSRGEAKSTKVKKTVFSERSIASGGGVDLKELAEGYRSPTKFFELHISLNII